ncbi:DUF4296 domain-containing protein [uncultured Flavobacterium sp.]|uniref:DUF4296 domain-containing protein n=1 Tax=uncultured Flavobacterium sp. TaxID=165435 RepID=UPI0030ED4574|tara:strand:+ start:166249 stop:166644 length:396 start_codon:yes stop_codon:yes gene_type:complete
MKKLLFIFISALLFSCNDKPVSKPDNLLSKETMEDIIYELAILQAAETYKPQTLSDSNIKIKQYVYKKYNLDSTTYFQNYKYYASDIKVFKKIYKQVNERILNQKNEIDTLLKSKKIEVPEDVPIYTPQVR